eukprot:gnl/MRDRNA2_/MRDRNA2_31764_c0_seq2.p1 gnl/MRDRNA2_/MRDRNA2_31764_c0~~gnl/MRDRNA2_/MRDRNA2_31764_c0_seq2.p1  ORF type:complete len:149 (+),score=23.26 gnl/MRDRNA2_/MRDRNA2_31764_c0_seq2:115-561(+)
MPERRVALNEALLQEAVPGSFCWHFNGGYNPTLLRLLIISGFASLLALGFIPVSSGTGIRQLVVNEPKITSMVQKVKVRRPTQVRTSAAPWPRQAPGPKTTSEVLRVALVDNGSLKPEATLSLRRLAAALESKAKEAGSSGEVRLLDK